MQNTERQKFEENWKSAFDGAEMTPPDNVWNSIELDIAGQESAAMKKRVVFYQRLAAATVLFALLTGTYAFYSDYSRVENKEVVKNSTPANSEQVKPENKTATTEGIKTAPTKEVRTGSVEPPKKELIAQPATEETIALVEEPNTAPEEQTMEPAEPVKEESVKEETIKEETVSPILQTAPLTASLEEQKAPEQTEKKKSNNRSTWLALGAAAGNYSPNAGGPAHGLAMADANTAYSGPMFSTMDAAPMKSNVAKVGSSYSVGMAVGKKFGRLVLQTGVNLNKQQVDYTSNYDTRTASNTAKASLSDYDIAEGASLTTTAPYNVNSSMEIVSIPVQAGYMIVDRRLGWQVNAGFSPDFFLRNTLVDKSGQRQKFTQGAGDASPYRSVNWSGLLNTELSYRLGDHYRVSLVPGVRYSFTSILKEPGNSGGKPLILDVGFRFRYMFD